jgi:hypothetical protein
MSEKERDQHMRDMARANEADVAEVLTQGQRNRLRQIDLQRKGLGAFREATIARELNLSADQKTRIEGIISEAFRMGFPGAGGAPGDGGPGRFGGPGFDFKKAQEEKRRTAAEKIQALLTAEQKKKWSEMVGEPYKGPLPGPGFFPGPGHPRDHHRDRENRGENQ